MKVLKGVGNFQTSEKDNALRYTVGVIKDELITVKNMIKQGYGT